MLVVATPPPISPISLMPWLMLLSWVFTVVWKSTLVVQVGWGLKFTVLSTKLMRESWTRAISWKSDT